MPSYQSTPFKEPVKLVIAGHPEYLWGSWNDRTGPTFGNVIQSLGLGATGEIVFQIRSGNAPVVGALITVRGTNRSSNFNVVNAVIIATTTVMDTGVCAVAYAISSTTLPIGADAGEVEIPQPEVGEPLVNGASAPVTVSFSTANSDQKRGITVVVSFPSIPTAAVVTLQQAVLDREEEYANVAVVATVAGGVITVGPQVTVDPVLGRFFRVNNSGVSGGTLPTVVTKLLS
jgi:hypothetical protein